MLRDGRSVSREIYWFFSRIRGATKGAGAGIIYLLDRLVGMVATSKLIVEQRKKARARIAATSRQRYFICYSTCAALRLLAGYVLDQWKDLLHFWKGIVRFRSPMRTIRRDVACADYQVRSKKRRRKNQPWFEF